MSCRSCSHCKRKAEIAEKKEKEIDPKIKKALFQKNARYSYAIGALFRKTAKAWEKQAEEIK